MKKIISKAPQLSPEEVTKQLLKLMSKYGEYSINEWNQDGDCIGSNWVPITLSALDENKERVLEILHTQKPPKDIAEILLRDAMKILRVDPEDRRKLCWYNNSEVFDKGHWEGIHEILKELKIPISFDTYLKLLEGAKEDQASEIWRKMDSRHTVKFTPEQYLSLLHSDIRYIKNVVKNNFPEFLNGVLDSSDAKDHEKAILILWQHPKVIPIAEENQKKFEAAAVAFFSKLEITPENYKQVVAFLKNYKIVDVKLSILLQKKLSEFARETLQKTESRIDTMFQAKQKTSKKE